MLPPESDGAMPKRDHRGQFVRDVAIARGATRLAQFRQVRPTLRGVATRDGERVSCGIYARCHAIPDHNIARARRDPFRGEEIEAGGDDVGGDEEIARAEGEDVEDHSAAFFWIENRSVVRSYPRFSNSSTKLGSKSVSEPIFAASSP
jgi:hypothetical protein